MAGRRVAIARYDVWLVTFDPIVGSEIAKTRPAVVVSPDEMNGALATVIMAPMTSTIKAWPSRVGVSFAGKAGEVALDQVRAVDKSRLVKRLGRLSASEETDVSETLVEMFTL